MRCALLVLAVFVVPGHAVAQKKRAPAKQPSKTVAPTHHNVSYGPHPRLKLNFWKVPSQKPTPLLVEIHGGGWNGGKKRERVRPAQLKKGYSLCTIDYRLSRHALLPAAVHDAARAIQFLRTKAKEWNFDPDRIVVRGGSAGAASSMWLAFADDRADPKSKDPVLRQSSRVAGAIGNGGQTTLDPFLLEKRIGPACVRHAMIWRTLGAESLADLKRNWKRFEKTSIYCSPITHVSKGDAPVFLTYRNDRATPVLKGDGIHHANFGRLLKEKCDAVGVECHLQIRGQKRPALTADAFLERLFAK